jgi:3-isopropylmalate/(R)-2-methylmalate dehydratase small subunit
MTRHSIREPFTTLTSTAVVLPFDDVDTDQIIPARFLTTTGRSGLGAHLFADWRQERSAVLARATAGGTNSSRILVTGRNFGCGSSREHAPWALLDFGFRAVIALSFADIFRENALKNALLTVTVSAEESEVLLRALETDPSREVTIELASQTVSLAGGFSCGFPIAPFEKRCLAQGVDQLGYLLDADDEISTFERAHSSVVRTFA